MPTETEVENAVALAIATHQVRNFNIVGDVDWEPWVPIARIAISTYKSAITTEPAEVGSSPIQTTTGPTPERIREEVEVARKHLYTALGSITLLTGYVPDFPAISDHIKQALAMLPRAVDD